MENKIKSGLGFLIFIVLLLPMVQQEFPLFPEKNEAGSRTNLYREFSWKAWWDGSFWNLRAQFLNDNMGFKNDFTKLNNQLEYSLFGKYKSQSLVIGDKNYLYYRSFISPYFGRDYVGRAAIMEKVRKMKALQDTFARLGKSLVFIQAPCKVSYYPEFLPEEYKSPKAGPNNYDTYAEVADAMGLDHIDFNAWFLSLKNKSKELLFTKESIHWSMYGSLLAADSLVRYMEQLRHVRMVHPVWSKIEHTRKARYSDDDITQSMKMLFPFSGDIYSYPVVTYPTDASMVRPKAVYIGDSYFFNWVKGRFMDNININWELWFYYREIWDRYDTEEGQPHKPIAGYDWLKAIGNTDFIIIMYSSANDAHVGDGFIEQAYGHYYPEKK